MRNDRPKFDAQSHEMYWPLVGWLTLYAAMIEMPPGVHELHIKFSLDEERTGIDLVSTSCDQLELELPDELKKN